MHVLEKLSTDKAVFKKFQDGLEEDSLVKVDFKIKEFEQSARDLNNHEFAGFYKS